MDSKRLKNLTKIDLKDFDQIKIAFKALIKWSLLALAVGSVVGLLAALFCLAIGWSTETRMNNPWLLIFLPFAGLLIVWVSQRSHDQSNIDTVIGALNSNKKIPAILAPVIMFSTFISHLFGASVGREGAALQLGGSLGETIGKLLHLSPKDKKIMIVSGMAAAFSALFGTPIAAALFPLAFARVGSYHFAALLPCLVSSLIAGWISTLVGNAPEHFLVINAEINIMSVLLVAVLAILAGLVSILFAKALYKGAEIMKNIFANPYLRIFVGGAITLILTTIIWNTDYLGGGIPVIERAFEGDVSPWAWLLKIVFTCVAVAAGFKGGEIIPSFFIGATLGAVLAPILGLPVDVCAACGLIAVFCGVTNSPIVSIVMAIELFGAEGLVLYAVAVVVSYIVSGYYGIYKNQKFGTSKFEWGKTKMRPRDVLE